MVHATRIQSHLLGLCALFPLWLNTSAARADLRPIGSEHYAIYTDVDQSLALDLARRMDVMFEEYSKRLADFRISMSRPFEVRIFAHRADYTALTGDGFRNTGGVFMSRNNLLSAFLEGQGRDALRRTLQHEAFHQFAYTAIGPNMPIWLNEGIAQTFEEGIWNGRNFDIEQVPPRRIRQLRFDIENQRLMPFARFLALTSDDWTRDLADAPTAASRYDQAWAMTYFLIFARDVDGSLKYRPRFLEMLRQLHLGTDPQKAFVSAFSDNYQGFQQRFLEYARTLAPTADATFFEYQQVLADMLVQAQLKGVRFDDVDEFRKRVVASHFRLNYSGKNTNGWTTADDPSIYFRDATGRLMTRQQMYLSPRGGAPLPDIVSQPIDGFQFRTMFHDAPDGIDHETILEVGNR